MNEEQLQLIYNDYGRHQGFKDYNEFKSLLSNENSRKEFFNASKSDLGFTDYKEFNSLIGAEKKNPNVTTSTTKKESTVSEPTIGSSGFGQVKANPLAFNKQDNRAKELNLDVRENQLRTELSNVKVTPKNSEEVSKKTDELSSIITQKRNTDLQNKRVVDEGINKSIFTHDENKINADIQEEETKNQGILNGVKAGLTGLQNYLGWGEESKTGKLEIPVAIPYEKEIKEANQEVLDTQKLHPNFKPTQEQIKKRAKEIFIEKSKQKQYAENAKKVLSDVDPLVQNRLKTNVINSIPDLKDEGKSISVQIQSLDNIATPLRKELANEEKLIKSGQADQNFIDEHNAKKSQYNDIESQYFKLLDKQNKNIDKVKSAEDRLKIFSLDYNPYHKALADLALPTEKIIGEIAYGIGKVENKFVNAIGGNQTEKEGMLAVGNDILDYVDKEQEKYPQVSFKEGTKSFGNFGQWVTQTIGNVAPFAIGMSIGTTEEQLASKAFLTPSKGLGAFSTASAGGAMREMDKDLANNPNLDYNNWQYAGKILGNVTSNAVMFGNYGAMLKGNKALFESIAKTPTASLEFQKGIQDYLSKAVETAKGINKSGTIMAGSQAINMFVDNNILGKKHENGLDELVDAYIEGGAMHGLISEVPNLGVYMLEKVVPNTTKKAMQVNLAKTYSLEKELQNPNLTTEEKSKLESQIKEVNKDSEKILKASVKQVEGFTKNQVKELLVIDQEKFAITKEVEDIKNGNFSREYKENALKEKKAEFSTLENRRQDVYSNEHNALGLLPKNEQNRLEKEAKEQIANKQGKEVADVKFDDTEVKSTALKIHKTELNEQAKTEVTKPTESQQQAPIQENIQETTAVENAEPIQESTEIENAEIPNTNEGKENGITNANGNVSVGNEKLGENGIAKQENIEPKSVSESVDNRASEKPNEVKKVKSVNGAIYDIHFDKNGNIEKIISNKDGREINQFIEKNGKLRKNPNYSQIEADATGGITNYKSKTEERDAVNKSVKEFTPTNEHEVALKALADGVKVSRESISKELGHNDNTKWATSKDGQSIERLAEDLASENPSLDEKGIRDAIIDVIGSHSTISEAKISVYEKYNENSKRLQEQEARAFLNGLSEKDLAMYESIKAEDEYLSELSGKEIENYYNQKIKEYEQSTTEATNEKSNNTTSINEKTSGAEEKIGVSKEKYDEFKKAVKDIPDSGNVKKYLSGETIEKNYGTPENAQEYDAKILTDLSQHGTEVLSKAKELFGEQYVEKTLEFLDDSDLNPFEKAIQYVALMNEMDRRLQIDPNNLSDKKLQKLVYAKYQANARIGSLTINVGRLMSIMKYGIDPNRQAEKLLSSKEKEAKTEIEKIIQVTPEKINEFEDSNNIDIEKAISEGVEKKINEIYSKLPTARRIKADKAIKALENIQKNLRGKAYDASIGIPVAIIDSSISVIKSAIKAGVNIADAIELGINHIKEKYGKEWENEDRFRKDMLAGFKEEGFDTSKVEKSIKDTVKELLIEAGFSREVKTKGEVKTFFDWKKLAGEEGSIDKIKENVENVLKSKGYSESEIKETSKSFEDEYNRLSEEIINKGLAELENRNLIKPSPNRKLEAKRLAELYNYGLMESKEVEYENIMNKVLGLSDLDAKSYQKIKNATKALADIFNAKRTQGKLTEQAVGSLANQINHQIKTILHDQAFKNAPKRYKIANIASEFAGLAQKSLLENPGNAIENVLSGLYASAVSRGAGRLKTELTPEMRRQNKENAKVIFDDINTNAGLFYGDTNTSLISQSRVEEWLNGKSDNRLYHAILSTLTGRVYLEATDSMVKSDIANTYFAKNAIEILSHESNKESRMSKEEALKYVSDNTTGIKFKEALEEAKRIVDEINSKQTEKQLADTPQAIHRFAMDIVRDNLISGGRMTQEQVEKAYVAGYKSAGRDIGHVANNVVSQMVGYSNSNIQTKLENAVKEKEWNKATMLSLTSIITKNIMNPFVGGGTNWVVRNATKAGLSNPLSVINLISDYAMRKDIDLSTETGRKNLEEALYRKANLQSTTATAVVGSVMALAVFASLKANDDEGLLTLDKWLKDNEWARKYFDKLSPESATMLIALEDKENHGIYKHYVKSLGMKTDVFNDNLNLLKSLDKENTSTLGIGASIATSPFTTPGPWRMYRDIQNIKRGLNGLQPIKSDPKITGFWNGVFKGGFVDYIGLRPESKYGTKDQIDFFRKQAEFEKEFKSTPKEKEAKAKESISKRFEGDIKKWEELKYAKENGYKTYYMSSTEPIPTSSVSMEEINRAISSYKKGIKELSK